jgi:hypothetical protein
MTDLIGIVVSVLVIAGVFKLIFMLIDYLED